MRACTVVSVCLKRRQVPAGRWTMKQRPLNPVRVHAILAMHSPYLYSYTRVLGQILLRPSLLQSSATGRWNVLSFDTRMPFVARPAAEQCSLHVMPKENDSSRSQAPCLSIPSPPKTDSTAGPCWSLTRALVRLPGELVARLVSAVLRRKKPGWRKRWVACTIRSVEPTRALRLSFPTFEFWLFTCLVTDAKSLLCHAVAEALAPCVLRRLFSALPATS